MIYCITIIVSGRGLYHRNRLQEKVKHNISICQEYVQGMTNKNLKEHRTPSKKVPTHIRITRNIIGTRVLVKRLRILEEIMNSIGSLSKSLFRLFK